MMYRHHKVRDQHPVFGTKEPSPTTPLTHSAYPQTQTHTHPAVTPKQNILPSRTGKSYDWQLNRREQAEHVFRLGVAHTHAHPSDFHAQFHLSNQELFVKAQVECDVEKTKQKNRTLTWLKVYRFMYLEEETQQDNTCMKSTRKPTC